MARTANEVAGFGCHHETRWGIHGGRLRRFRASFTMWPQGLSDDIIASQGSRLPFAFGIINVSATFGASATVAIGIAGATGITARRQFSPRSPTLFVSTATDDDD